MSSPMSFSPSPDVLLVFITDQTQLEARGGGGGALKGPT